MGKLIFVNTCLACPEQYDVIYEHATGDEKYLAYVRLRHGHLRASDEPLEETFYSHQFEDTWKGGFDDNEERGKYLQEIANVLCDKFGYNKDDTPIEYPNLDEVWNEWAEELEKGKRH